MDKKAKDATKSNDEDVEPENHIIKVVVIGPPGTGKTQVITRYCEDYFTKKYKQTIGIDFFQKRVELPGDVNVAMHLWDVDGNAIAGKMLETYLYDAVAIVFVYDVTSLESFKEIDSWSRQISLLRSDQRLSSSEEPMRILFGNKNDMQHAAEVTLEQHN